jgi:ribosomal protein L31E
MPNKLTLKTFFVVEKTVQGFEVNKLVFAEWLQNVPYEIEIRVMRLWRSVNLVAVTEQDEMRQKTISIGIGVTF